MSEGTANPVEAQISKEATTSLITGILGLICCALLGIWAIIAANNTNKLIAQHNVGQEHQTKATIGKVLGIISLVLWLLAIAFNILTMVLAIGAGAAGP